MWYKLSPKRFELLKVFVLFFVGLSSVVRLIFLLWNLSEVDVDFFDILRIFMTGLFFDLGTISFFTIPYLLYLMIMPNKWVGSLFDRIATYTGFTIGILVLYFSFFAEITFWDEFHRRFNFIAVDYLIYTYEVVRNINESYPLPILISSILLLTVGTIYLIYKCNSFEHVFKAQISFKTKVLFSFPWVVIAICFTMFVSNEAADWSGNRYNNELSKAGIYSFFAAFRNNELSYTEFYKTLTKNESYALVSKQYEASGDLIDREKNPIYRNIPPHDTLQRGITPNVIFICVESLSAKFLGVFGNEKGLTPNLDKLSKEGVLFSNLYATGTRTVRGMEAITLSIPPTPGRSIVKREHNTGMFTIGEVFKNKGYSRNFYYGGDGYFDNMNAYFSGNDFNIIDRGREFLIGDQIKTIRTNINDNEVSFENAWGVCDEDIFNKVIQQADIQSVSGKPFFDFIMTTSNHKPYTYPEGKIDIPSGSGRDGAVKYTDYAIGKFIEKAKSKPWFNNTVFVVMSDHCASSAGRWELDVKNYHIPAIIYNLPNQSSKKIDRLCSQIDIFPTLFGYFNWKYNSNFFGQDITKKSSNTARAFIGNYRKLGLLKGNNLMILGDQKTANFYKWDNITNGLTIQSVSNDYLNQTISFYQTADDLYTSGKLTLKSLKE
ncbi:sulfatase-like hydrolase/transferase [Galbibacter sp. CMA-7]|uniref:Sulfatase-like hydrolase/transferase n=2 Tax=Galbibacter pacificus TaxID=2996052 RepID=A0ABT6FWY9_9FLAO|nr:alkaline phosphatase family protein [Galbibacter pacificus]MDG3583946.1 sulfatase-like hydrolase/transferase [Galbibacter pacificus]MDG3587616.1 sulfatase-like hydrolase/transferase [Galbibacter pacificus]